MVPIFVEGIVAVLGDTNIFESGNFSAFVLLLIGVDDLVEFKLVGELLCACLGNGSTLDVGLVTL